MFLLAYFCSILIRNHDKRKLEGLVMGQKSINHQHSSVVISNVILVHYE